METALLKDTTALPAEGGDIVTSTWGNLNSLADVRQSIRPVKVLLDGFISARLGMTNARRQPDPQRGGGDTAPRP